MDLSNLHFLRPWWLLIALPPLALVALRLARPSKSAKWEKTIAPHLLPHLLTGQEKHPWLSPEVVLLPFALVLALAMAGPAYKLADTPHGPAPTTLLIIVDLSSSMKGTDLGPSRAGRLRLKLRDLISMHSGGRVGLIAVAGDAHVVLPPTDDVEALIPYVDVLDPQLMPTDGEAFVNAVPLVRRMLEKEAGPSLVLVAADSIPPDGARALATLGRNGTALVGWTVGTDAGVPGSGIPGLDRSGFDAIDRSGASLVDLSLNNSDLRAIAGLLSSARSRAAKPSDAALWEDAGYLLVPLVALGSLLWFRKGWVLHRVGVLALLLLTSGCGGGGSAASSWNNLWFTPDQQGRHLFEQHKYKQAAQRFEDPMWKGIAYYASSDWKNAQAQFARVDTVDGLFNLANAHAQAREIASAIAVYNQVLTLRPTHRAARKNRDYLQDVLSGLRQTTDWDDLDHPADRAADQTKADLRPDQAEGRPDNAERAQEREAASNLEDSLTATENERWMKRVTTNPADFLRAKFSILEQDRGKK